MFLFLVFSSLYYLKNKSKFRNACTLKIYITWNHMLNTPGVHGKKKWATRFGILENQMVVLNTVLLSFCTLEWCPKWQTWRVTHHSISCVRYSIYQIFIIPYMLILCETSMLGFLGAVESCSSRYYTSCDASTSPRSSTFK
jgi:hypothetical protein